MKKVLRMLLALALVLSMMPVAMADTTIDGTAKRGIKAKDVGLNEVVDGVSPTTGLDLNDMEKPDGFAGLAITGRYLPMLVQIDNYDGGVSEMAPWGATYADIIYETPLHSSGFTRLTFLFSDLIPDSVGPVRSARVGHAVLREEWDAGFLFYGMQTYAKANVKDVFKKYGASKKGVLFSGTIDSNLKFGGEHITDADVKKAAAIAQATEFIDAKPEGYQSPIAQGGSNVSGGQKQRLTIARALLRKPKVLILDDSTSAVDTATDAKIRKAFREEIPGTTKIIIAQRISSVQDADRILVLDNGKIDGLGTHEELLKTNAIYQEVYNSQTQGGGDFDKQGGEQ